MEEATPVTEGKMTQLVIDFLINIPLFDNLTSKELRIVAKYMNLVDAEPREIVFKEGDKGSYVCFVVDGMLEVLKKSERGKETVLTTLSRGRSIGEMAVIDNYPRSATVRARSKSTLLTLSQEKFNAILEEHPSIGVKLLKGIARLLSLGLRQTSSRLVDFLHPTR